MIQTIALDRIVENGIGRFASMLVIRRRDAALTNGNGFKFSKNPANGQMTGMADFGFQ